jgi:hypothetical protein
VTVIDNATLTSLWGAEQQQVLSAPRSLWQLGDVVAELSWFALQPNRQFFHAWSL